MERKTIRVVAAVAQEDGCYLITQRRKTAVLPLFWEFPGGKVEGQEQDEDALRRELRERLGAEFTIGKKLAEQEHSYKEGTKITMALYEATLGKNQTLSAKRVEDFRWVPATELGFYEFPGADQQVIALLDLPK